MIPKKIHYCWFGNNPLPESVQKCISSWKEHCSDYEIIQWNETNYDINKNDYIKEAYQAKKYAFVSDFVRLDIINIHGGIYLDTDVELIKNLDPFLSEEAFLGMEKPGIVATGLGFGAHANNGFIMKNIKQYDGVHFIYNGKENKKTCVEYTMDALQEYEFNPVNKLQKLTDMTIFPTDYFCPLDYETNKIKITNNTFSIHWYDASWYSSNKYIRNLKKEKLKIYTFLRKQGKKFLGVSVYEKLKKLLK